MRLWLKLADLPDLQGHTAVAPSALSLCPHSEEPPTDSPGTPALSQGMALRCDLSPDGGKEETKGKASEIYFKDAVENKGFGAQRELLYNYDRKEIRVSSSSLPSHR